MHTLKSLAREKKGAWFAVLSGLFYGLFGYFGVTLMRSGISVYNLSFWRFAIAFVIMVGIVWYRGIKGPLTVKSVVSTLINGGVFYGGAGIIFFLACQYIGTGQSMVIFFIYPMWVIIYNWLFDGQPLMLHYFLSFGLILVGLIFLVDVTELNFNFMGVTLSILASLFYAIYLIWSKKLDVSPIESTMMVSLGCAVVGGVLAIMDNTLMLPTKIEQWLYLLGFATICTTIPILLLLKAMNYLSSEKASLLSVFEPLFAVIFGVLLLGEILYMNTVIGMVLTLAGAILVVVRWPDFVTNRFKRCRLRQPSL